MNAWPWTPQTMTLVHHRFMGACAARIAGIASAKGGVKTYELKGDTSALDRAMRRLKRAQQRT